MSQAPLPGWYADPQGVSVYRWWDGIAWTAHTANGQPANPVAQQSVYGGTMTAATARTTQFRPAPTVSGGQRNKYALITLGIVALYALIAWKAHVYVLGILPVMMSIRSKSRNEPLAAVAIIAAAVAILVAVLGFTHH
ncbi:MAG TPA: DUF2510 domain-containing protein [Frankiaceae bacterium]|nr:DUF2510 domain-containing protein [Frankiaceae bacterium]